MAFTLTVDGVLPLLNEDGATDIMLENGADLLTLEGAVDVSAAALLYGSVTLKLNTLDFGTIDYPAPPTGAAVTVTDPAWTGTVAAATTADPVDLINGRPVVVVTATNATALPSDTAPFDLSDTPSASTPFDYLLEDGSGHYLLESGTDFATASSALMLEGALAYGYSGLSVRRMAGSPPTTLATCTVQKAGLRPGNTVHLTSQNQGYAAYALQVNQATLRWQGVPLVPVYTIEMGDTPQTLALWTQVTAPAPAPILTPPVVIPSGPVIYGNASTGHTLYAAGGGIVTVASSTFTVSAAAGHTLTVQVVGQIDCRAYGWDNYVAVPRRAVRALLSGAIYTGAWQETPGGTPTTAGARATYDVSSAPGIALAAGTYTLSLQIDTQEANQMEVFSGWVQAAVTTV